MKSLPILCFAVATSSMLGAQDAPKSVVVEASTTVKQAQKNKVSAADVEKRLKLRTPKFRKVKVFDAKDMPKIEPKPTQEPQAAGKPKSRLMGDGEKAKLAADVIVTIDGSPATEGEVMDLANYFAKSEGGAADTHVTRALNEILRVRVIEAGLGKDEIAKLKKQINELHSRANKGEDFASIAKQHSHCPSGKQAGGSLGSFGRRSMVAPFARHAFSTAVGKVSPVFATNFGYHFLKVTGKQKGEKPDMDQVTASHVLIMFDKTQQKTGSLMMRLDGGKADLAVRDDNWRKKLPENLR